MGEIKTLAREDLPPLLREIPDAPHSLYVRGALPPTTHTLLAVVGTRRMTRFGKEACEHVIAGLAGYPISIVSGLALGIDGVAHQAALRAGLHTTAVLGCGLSDAVLYPRSHVRLAHDILDAGGALVSEEEPDFRARIESFPKRNRIMAGMSNAVLVVEATLQSGTLITARLAVDYNRDVLTVPGSLFSETAEGPHLLLKLGATPVRSASDILEALHLDEYKKEMPTSLEEDERAVIEALSEPTPRDELLRALHTTVAEGNALLLRMELKNLIVESGGVVRKNI